VPLYFFYDLYIGPLADFLPTRMLVRSSGTFYPNFKTILIFQILHLFYLCIFSLFLLSISVRLTKNAPKFLFVLVGIFVYWFYASNSFPPIVNANFMINKVNFASSDVMSGPFIVSRSSTAYPLFVRAANLFYDYQHIFTGICAVFIFIIVNGIISARFKETSSTTNLIVSFCICFCGALTSFSFGAEDVLFNIIFILLFLYFSVKPNLIMANLTLVCIYLNRPQLLPALFPLYLYLHISNYISERNFKKVALGPFIFLTFLFSWNVILYQFDLNWLVSKSGSFLSAVENFNPIRIEGFTIHRWSMTFYLHSFWIYGVVGLLFYPFLYVAAKKQYWLELSLGLGFLINCVVHDFLTMFYFNWRYLTYFFPVMVLSSHFVLNKVALRAKYLNFYHIVLALSLFTFYEPFIGKLNWLPGYSSFTSKYETDFENLWNERDQLRKTIGDDSLRCEPDKHICRMVSYVLIRSYGEVRRRKADYLVISTNKPTPSGSKTIYEGKRIKIVKIDK
jgi:hypothetical protein